jgi:hypothetical protein
VHKELVLMLRMHYELVDLVTLELLLPYLEKVVGIDIPLADTDVPHTDLASRVTYKDPPIRVKSHAVRMNVIEGSILLS